LKKRYIVIALILLVILTVIIKNGKNLKEGIEISLQEDFKIKESLGQVFFLEKQPESTAVSGEISVTSMILPCNGELTQKEILGEKCIVISSDMFEGVYATADGVIENAENSKITIRHYDGTLSSYYGATALVKKGESVKKGDTVGYSKGELIFKLFKNCVSIDPLEYMSLDQNK